MSAAPSVWPGSASRREAVHPGFATSKHAVRGTEWKPHTTTTVLGLSYKEIPLTDHASLTGLIEMEKAERRSARLHAGAELWLDSKYAIRAGYDRDNFSAGVGYSYRRVKIDYAFKALDYLTDSHRFSLSLLLGPSVSEKRANEQQKVRQAGTVLLEDERQRQLEFFKAKADAYNDQFRLDSALAYYYRALAFDEDNKEIIGGR